MPHTKFDSPGFFASLDAVRHSRRMTWKDIAEKSGVSASTLTRLSQGKKPDVDTLSALCNWASLSSNDYTKSTQDSKKDTLNTITMCLRADPKLSIEAATAIDALVKSLYEKLRSEEANN